MLRFTRPTSIVLLSLNIVFISLQDALDVRYLNQLTDTAIDHDHEAFVPVIQYKKGTILSLILYMSEMPGNPLVGGELYLSQTAVIY